MKAELKIGLVVGAMAAVDAWAFWNELPGLGWFFLGLAAAWVVWGIRQGAKR